jgi:hypothetical protein
MTTETKGASIVGNTYTIPAEDDLQPLWLFIYGESHCWGYGDTIKVLAEVIDSEGITKYVTLNTQIDVLNTANLPIEFFNELDSLTRSKQYKCIDDLQKAITDCRKAGVSVYFDTFDIQGIKSIKRDDKPIALLSSE